MSVRKIIVYQRYSTKPVILTDSSDTSEKIQNQILEILKSDKISILETQNDILIFRPSEIQSILITNTNSDAHNDLNSDSPDSTKSIKTPHHKPYIDNLTMEKK
jgi:hypothetical protein